MHEDVAQQSSAAQNPGQDRYRRRVITQPSEKLDPATQRLTEAKE
jgi:hypothetical protein